MGVWVGVCGRVGVGVGVGVCCVCWYSLTNQTTRYAGPAVHLVNLHPPSASIAPPSVALVQTIITRAALPLETIALAVCILDSLDAKFSRKWRMTLPLARGGATTTASSISSLNKRHTIAASPSHAAAASAASAASHIDSVRPELIILTALVVAFKFTEDCQEPTQYYASDWGRGHWTCDQINATERCIMEHLGYRILPLCDPAILDEALADMRRAGLAATREREQEDVYQQQQQQRAMMTRSVPTPRLGLLDVAGHARSISVPVRPGSGEAVIGLGFSLTPVDTPTEERNTELGAPA